MNLFTSSGHQDGPTDSSIEAGTAFPLGAIVTETGVNFCVFSSHATTVSLLLFPSAGAEKASRVIHLDPKVHRTSHYWHLHVIGVSHGQVYAYRMDGPDDPSLGHCFNVSKVLIDPYGRAICSMRYRRQDAIGPGDNEGTCLRSAVIDLSKYDWEDDRPLQTPFHNTIIYEIHVGGFTRHPTSGLPETKRGTYAGLVDKITCHDGFTLNDLFSFDRRHNDLNQEANRDGADDNRSWNCGEEGPTASYEIEELRARQVRNFFALNLLSLGTPFLLMGDEVRRSQHGNNNAYCQNNVISWFDWELVDKQRGLFGFVQHLIRLRKNFLGGITRSTLTEWIQCAQISWYGVEFAEPDLSDDSHSLAVTVPLSDSVTVHMMLNMYWEPLDFVLPCFEEHSRAWCICVDTFENHAGCNPKRNHIMARAYTVQSRSIVVLAG